MAEQLQEHAKTKAYAKGGVILSSTMKSLAYRNKQYVMYQAPVNTTQWSEVDWIQYIDTNGHWTL